MGTKEVTMETKYAALFASVQAGQESVTELYARLGISRKSYYKYLARFASEGLEGLRSRSGAQAREAPGSPSTTSAVRRRAVPMQPSLRLMHDRFRSPAAAFSGRVRIGDDGMSSGPRPPGTYWSTAILSPRMKSSDTAARTASSTSRPKRVRFCRLPPYASMRGVDLGLPVPAALARYARPTGRLTVRGLGSRIDGCGPKGHNQPDAASRLADVVVDLGMGDQAVMAAARGVGGGHDTVFGASGHEARKVT